MFIKDIIDLLNRIKEFNKNGFFFEGILLVFWDVVLMFFNIDNNLGFIVVEKVFDVRDKLILLIKCIFEVVEICLKCNYLVFKGDFFL